MSSSENVTLQQEEIEKAEKEIIQESPEVQIVEISNEQLQEYANVVEQQIEQQSAEITQEGEQRVEASLKSMNILPEMVQLVREEREEQELDAKFGGIQAEAEQFAGKAKGEIEAIIKEQTPEELKVERKMAIGKKLMKEWELKNGPMERPLSGREIEKNKEMARLWGEEWDGRTTQMTENASEFYFDHRGRGRSAIPSQVDKIFTERFPEYEASSRGISVEQLTEERKANAITEIKNAIEDRKHIRSLKGGENLGGYEEGQLIEKHTKSGLLSSDEIKSIKNNKSESKNVTREGTAEENEQLKNENEYRLSKILEKAGVESKIVKVENGGEFSEVIILEKKEIPTEKMVRLYRGVNHLDASVLEQIPYAMRAENGSDKPTILEDVRNEVHALAENPTYENLLIYTDKVRSSLNTKELRYLDEDLLSIEDGVLEGYSIRKELVFKQIGHPGGRSDSGVTPYISASSSPYEAAEYGKEGLIVIDIPLSEIEYLDSTETNIKGSLDKKYITAILPRNREEAKDKENREQEIYRAMQKVYESVDVPLYDNESLRFEREKRFGEETELDKQQWQEDVEKVRQKRVTKLVKEFPEAKIDFQKAQHQSLEQKIDVYTKVKRDIFDQYKTRLEKIGRNGRDINDYGFSESEYGQRKNFDRDNVSDIMLTKLRSLVLRLEEKELERAINR